MSDVVISYSRSTARQAGELAKALRTLGYDVWMDDELPAHRPFAEVIEERLKGAKAVVVIWSAGALKSHWVRAEASAALRAGTLVQMTFDGTKPPMPFDQIQCARMSGWSGDPLAPGLRNVVASIADLVGGSEGSDPPPDASPPALPGKPSIVVFPFVNLSSDPEQDYFADGMVEEVVTALTRFKSIFVIGGGSSLSFKGKATTPQEAARILGVRYVLEGSVRRAGDRVRIAVKLIDATDAVQIWADRFEDTLDDIFALQDRVALAVAGVIEPAVREAESQRARARPTESMNSYDLVLRAGPLYRTWSRAGTMAALELLDRALAQDPDYGWALALAVTCHSSIIVYGWSDDPEKSLAELKALTHRAIEVGRDDPEVLAHLANGLFIGGDLEAALVMAERAIVLNPGSSLAWMISGTLRLLSGEPQLGAEHLQKSLRLDPLSPDLNLILQGLGVACFAQGQFREAVALLKQSAQLRPEWPIIHLWLAASFAHLGDLVAARESIARYHDATSVDVTSGPQSVYPELRKLLLEGLALAELGSSPGSAGEG